VHFCAVSGMDGDDVEGDMDKEVLVVKGRRRRVRKVGTLNAMVAMGG